MSSLLDTSSASRWDIPVVEGPVTARRVEKPKPATVSHLESVEKAAYEEAYAKGHAAGLAAAKLEEQKRLDHLTEQITRISTVLDALARPLTQVDAEVERELVSLAFTLARHLVRRELKTDPGQIIAVIRETVGLLPAAARAVRVHLHPDDAALVREKLAMPQEERAWSIIEDPVLTRGGCRVSTETAHIDARVETRMGAIMSTMLGDERIATEPEQRT